MAIVKDRGNPLSKTDPQLYPPGMYDDKPYQGSIPLTVGTTYAPMRSLLIVATAAGNVSVTLKDGSIIVIPVAVGLTTLPAGAVSINTTGTTATGTYYNMK